jgi:hypothetical protein
MTRMLGLIKVETNDKRKPSQGPQRNKDEPIPRQYPRMEGDEADPPINPPVTVAAQAGNPSRDIGANDPDPSGGEDDEDSPEKAREIVTDDPYRSPRDAITSRRRPGTPSLHPRLRRPSRSPSASRSPPKPARYAYGAWTIRCEITTTYLIEKVPAGQPELEKIAQKHQSASNLSNLVALPPGARKAVNKFLSRRKSSEASLVAMEPLKKRWNPFLRRRQERPMALLVLRLREDGLDDGRSVPSSHYSTASSLPGRRVVLHSQRPLRQAPVGWGDPPPAIPFPYDDHHNQPPIEVINDVQPNDRLVDLDQLLAEPRLNRFAGAGEIGVTPLDGAGRRRSSVGRKQSGWRPRPTVSYTDQDPPRRGYRRAEVFFSESPPSPLSSEEVPSTPEPPLPSQEEAEDLMAQYLAGFTAGPAEDGTQAREDEQMASKGGVNEANNVTGIGGQ